MPGEDYQSWSVTAVNNGNSDTSIEWREGQTRASVNNSSRSEMAAHAKNRTLLNGSIVTGGSANVQTFTSGVGYIAPIPTGLIVKLKIGTGLTNTASTTLNMDGIGDTVIKTDTGDNLKGGELIGGCYTDFLFNGTNWIFLYSRAFLQNEIDGGGGVIIGKQIFSTAGTFVYTPTPGMEACIIECVGGGGAGGCASSNATLLVCGGGGGSGGYSRTYGDATSIGASQAVVVGAGGTAAATPSAGGNGGDTSLGALCIAKGGLGGTGSITGGGIGFGGAGGPPGTGDVTAAGSAGNTGTYSATTTTTAPAGGAGGSSCFGGGVDGTAVGFGGTAAGAAARNYGAGGAGSVSHGGPASAPSGAGSAGIVIITEFAGRGAPGRDGATGAIGPVGPSGPGTGDVLRSGTPTVGQVAVWTDGSHIQGVAPSSLITGINNVVMQTFTASGTYTPTAGMKFCIIECVGGGGGGGGVVGDAAAVLGAGGGGAGGYSRKRATATDIGASKPVTVGAGGTVGTGNGGAGGVTSVGTLCVSNGGGGGIGVTLAQSGTGGNGASAGIGDVTATGASGHNGMYWNGSPAGFGPPAGAGGNSYYGGGGVAGQCPSTGNAVGGKNATGYGAGGGGASANNSISSLVNSGGTGSPGIVIITEFI